MNIRYHKLMHPKRWQQENIGFRFIFFFRCHWTKPQGSPLKHWQDVYTLAKSSCSVKVVFRPCRHCRGIPRRRSGRCWWTAARQSSWSASARPRSRACSTSGADRTTRCRQLQSAQPLSRHPARSSAVVTCRPPDAASASHSCSLPRHQARCRYL